MDAPLGRLLKGRGAGGGDLPLASPLRRSLLALGGLGCGASPAFFGYFGLSQWGPIGIGLVVLAIALVLARRSVPRGLTAVAVLALLSFGGWCLVSMGWAESGDRALIEGDRWIVYGLYLLVLALVMVDRRDAIVLLAATVVGILGVAAWDLAEMLNGGGRQLFSGSRLLEPLGYVNGLGGFYLFGLWPLLAVAERVRRPLIAGVAAGAATVLATLVLLTDSRGTAFAFLVSALLLLLLLPGRSRRAWAILAVVAGVLAAWGPLTDVIRVMPGGVPAQPAATIERGARWALLAGAGVGVFWALSTWAVDSPALASPGRKKRMRLASAAVLVVTALAVPVAVAVAAHDPAGRVSRQYEAFTQLEPIKGGSRFTSGGGNRYDYWRIAWNQFEDDPLKGIGAGNFDRTYFLERRTNEDVRQAHSIELQTLADTGLVGAVLLGAFFIAVFLGAWRYAREVRRRPVDEEIAVGVAAVGMFSVWLAQTSVDWLHLIPGLAGIALGAAAILLRGGRGETAAPTVPVPAPLLIAVVPLAVVAILFIGRPTLAENLRSEAKEELPSDPRRALAAAEESLSLNPDSLPGRYLEAAAFARLHAFQPAKRALREAIRREPHDYVSWALLGDLLTRRGAIAAAMRAYARAASLNPRDRQLHLLGTDRSLVARLHADPNRPGSP